MRRKSSGLKCLLVRRLTATMTFTNSSSQSCWNGPGASASRPGSKSLGTVHELHRLSRRRAPPSEFTVVDSESVRDRNAQTHAVWPQGCARSEAFFRGSSFRGRRALELAGCPPRSPPLAAHRPGSNNNPERCRFRCRSASTPRSYQCVAQFDFGHPPSVADERGPIMTTCSSGPVPACKGSGTVGVLWGRSWEFGLSS